MKFWNDHNSWFNRTGEWLSNRPIIFAIVPMMIMLLIGGLIKVLGSSWSDLADGSE